MIEAKAINRYIPSSPRKMRLVIDLIRNKPVDQALSILHYSPNHAARVAEKVVRSAIANLHNTDEGARIDANELFVKEVFVNGGPGMKRVLPAPMGRAFRIVKRSNHLTVVIAAIPKKVKQAAPKPRVKETAEKK